SEIESDDVVPKINTGDQDEGQAGPNPRIQDEGQAGPNPSVQDEGQARSNPSDAIESLPQSNEEFTITSYLNVQEHFTLPSKDLVILKEPPPPPPPPAGAFGALGTSRASGSSQFPLPPPYSSTSTSGSAQQQGTYETPAENSLLAKTGDMTIFLNWYCQQVNKIVLTLADLEGMAYEVVKAFYPDVTHLQFQMDECDKMLTYQVDWTNPEG
nr:hypothetical protein [Tanacetum cinerariifolium]